MTTAESFAEDAEESFRQGEYEKAMACAAVSIAYSLDRLANLVRGAQESSENSFYVTPTRANG